MSTHDYIISNASGAAVRADLNNALAAIVSNNSSASAPSTTYAYQIWIDTSTTPATIKRRDASNASWITLGAVDGSIPLGSAASPSLFFSGDTNTGIYSPGADQVGISTGGNLRAAVDSSGRLLVGTSSSTAEAKFIVQGGTTASGGAMNIQRTLTTASAGSTIGYINFTNSANDVGATISANGDGTWSAGTSHPTNLTFSTTASGASTPTERMRIGNDGAVYIHKTSSAFGSAGTVLYGGSAVNGAIDLTRSAAYSIAINRLTSDGNLIEFYRDSALQGTISVSGSTVSYNGAHLSRWSQLPSGAERTEILRGTILSNIDEMCEWKKEENEQLNRMKVSDVEGDKNVSGVFQAWDDDDDTYTNDFYCAMTGDFIIRIGAGVTVERGDLLMSAGDGTAKPQDDDIIRSKTIAKVTSTSVSCTYDDGSYCVPCVLMAC